MATPGGPRPVCALYSLNLAFVLRHACLGVSLTYLGKRVVLAGGGTDRDAFAELCYGGVLCA